MKRAARDSSPVTGSFKFTKQNISNLKVQVLNDLKQKRSPVWCYFGHLIYSGSNTSKKRVGNEYIFCKVCLDNIQAKLNDCEDTLSDDENEIYCEGELIFKK